VSSTESERRAAGLTPADVSVRPLLLRPKIEPPRLSSRHVRRPRLLVPLLAGRDARLTLVCAPAGYGKTALLAEWLEATDCPIAWVSLDADDSDPVRLWSHLVWASGLAVPELGRPLPDSFEILPNNLLDAFVPLLLDWLVRLSVDLVIVLDDYQFVRDDLCDASLAFFIQNIPTNVYVVIASRVEPGLPLGRLRAHGELVEVGADDLSLTAEEAAEVVRPILGAALPPETIETLVERTEGWPAGVHLTALRAQTVKEPEELVASLSGDNRFIFDFLQSDLLEQLPYEMQRFLRRSSILSQLTAPLCDAVLGATDSARLLEEAERANLFLVPLDDRREWFRYHHLFSDVLRRELNYAEPELLATLHCRASQWFERERDVEESINHAIKARDLERSSELLTRHFRSFVDSGRILTLNRWLAELSWTEALAHPLLALNRGTIAGITGRATDEVEPWLHVAERGDHDGPLPDGQPSIQFGVASVRSLFLLGDIAAALEAARFAIERAPPGSPWRITSLLALGHTLYLSGKALEARQVIQQAMLEHSQDEKQATATLPGLLALVELDRGEIARGEQLARRSLAALKELGLGNVLSASLGHLALGVALGAQGAFSDAEQEIHLGVKLRESRGPTIWHVHALVLLARARHALGDAEGATDALDEARAEMEHLRDAGIVSALVDDTQRRLRTGVRQPAATGEALSERELVILRLLAAGLTKPEIATELYISYNTVKTHTRTIYRKLGTSAREETIEHARTLGLI
jgi:LuxR family maltose regulon positive regulatory protein